MIKQHQQSNKFVPIVKRWLVLLIYTLCLTCGYYVQFSFNHLTAVIQNYFELETPSLVILSSLIFPMMIGPGIFISNWMTCSNVTTSNIFKYATIITILGACIRCFVLLFDNFVFVIIGNSFIALGHTLILSTVSSVARNCFADHERFMCEHLMLSSVYIGVICSLCFF